MAMVVDSFVGRYLGKLADFVEGEICRVLGVKEEIETLKRRLARIRPHLEAAEQRRHQDAAIKTWVTELKDVMYDVEDIIDDCMLEGGQLLEPHPPSSSSSSSSSSKVVSLPFCLLPSCFACTKYRHEIANRIEEVNRRLKEISEDKQLISELSKQSTSSKSEPERSKSFQMTTPLDVKAEALGRLVNLQTLSIGRSSLHRLPSSITELHNLRCLRLRGSPLSHLPKGIGRLTNLNYIDRFVPGHDNDVSEGCDLGELQCFLKMRHLEIESLERASSTGKAVLADKATFLRYLSLEWRGGFAEEQIGRAEKICGELMPPSTIENLTMEYFPGRRFPDWITSTSASTSLCCLTILKLRNCLSCTELPPLGRLPQLKCLDIKGACAIKTIGREFLGCSSAAAPAAFPKLEILKFTGMAKWEEWWLCEGEEGGDVKLLFPTLRECTLWYCPKLRGIPENLYRAPNLKKISVSSVDPYVRREYSRHRSIFRFAYDRFNPPPEWENECAEEEPKVAPSAPRKILFYVDGAVRYFF